MTPLLLREIVSLGVFLLLCASNVSSAAPCRGAG